jgi:hypothetical protein
MSKDLIVKFALITIGDSVKVTSKEEIAKRTAQGAIMAYVFKNMSLSWAIGVIRKSGVSKIVLNETMSTFRKENGDSIRLQELDTACQQNGLL